jgi:hypothetical protein
VPYSTLDSLVVLREPENLAAMIPILQRLSQITFLSIALRIGKENYFFGRFSGFVPLSF